jgi:hypothetical protein
MAISAKGQHTMLSKKKPTPSLQIGMRADLGLSLDTGTEVPEPLNSTAKFATLIDCAAELAAQHFPLLTESAWAQMLSHSKSFFDGELLAVQILSPGFLFNWIVRNRGSEDMPISDLESIAALSSLEQFAVQLVMDRFLSHLQEQEFDLRDFLARVSGRAPECVFEGDPSPGELWTISDVRPSSGEDRVEVLIDYAGEPIAVLGVTVVSDAEFKYDSFDLKSDRKLAYPACKGGLYGFLFEIAAPFVRDFLTMRNMAEPDWA